MLLPAIDGKLIDPLKMPKPNAAIWNYECMFKTKDIYQKKELDLLAHGSELLITGQRMVVGLKK